MLGMPLFSDICWCCLSVVPARSRLYHLSLVVQEPLDISHHQPYELALGLLADALLLQILKKLSEAKFNETVIEVFIGEDIKQRVDGLTSPLF